MVEKNEENLKIDEKNENEEIKPVLKKKKKSKKKSKGAKLQNFFKTALEQSKQLLDGVSKEQQLKMPYEFQGYAFTGSLRPSYVTKQIKVPEVIAQPDYSNDPEGIPHSEVAERRSGSRIIHIYEGVEIEKMKEICAIGRDVIDIGGKFIKVGVTGDEIDRIVHKAIVDRGCYPSPLNYRKFPKSLCVSVNEVICHGIPDCRPLKEGDIVNLDISVYKDGFHTDLNETFLVGKCDEDAVTVVKTAYECLTKACEMIRPGTMYRDVGAVISKHARANKCSVVKTYCGHGVGLKFHTAPNVPHYAKNKAVGIMRPGHIFTIEPMINFGNSWGDALWPDNWTAVTLNGNNSAQFEHTFLVTDTGVEILTARKGTPKDKMLWDLQAVQR